MKTVHKSVMLALWALGPSVFVSSALAQDAVPEKAALCAACHGEAGAKPIMPAYPVLAGQYANYLEHALKEYKSGARKNAVMAGQAATLSDAEIRALARYYAAQQGPLYTPKIPGHKVEPK